MAYLATFDFQNGRGEWFQLKSGACDEAHGRDHRRPIRVDQVPANSGPVVLARDPAGPGETVFSVGGSGAADNLLWRLTKGTVRGRVARKPRVDFGVLDCMILEADAPTNPGDSGGPVLNDRGELVAAVSHYVTRQRQVSGNIDVGEVRAFIDKHKDR
jgi:S1-C subfamily serine protease